MPSEFKWPIFISLGILFCLNILMVSSLSPNSLPRQLLAWFLGGIFFLIGRQINPKQIVSSKWFIFIVSCLFVIAPILLNNITRGSRRWIDIGPVNLQPSELVRPWLMLVLANTNFPFIHLIPVVLIILQPDLGSAVSVLFLLIPIIIFNKRLFKISLILAIIFLISTPAIWKYALHDYQRNRILTFINPNSDPLGKGYNSIQSKIAIGSGGLFGKGYRKGSQGQLLFLPEKHTDFMFAATTEELGLVGASIIIVAYYFLIKNLISKAFSCKDRVHLLFTLGITLQIWMQAFVNIGMNIGILPVTGIPLPFISYGGSSLMTLLFSLGIIFSS